MTAERDKNAWLQGGDAVCARPPPVVHRAWRLVLLGPPGVGKGTQAGLLSRALGACPLSLGDVFRAADHRPAPEGSAMAAAQECIAYSERITDEIILGLIRERSHCLHCQGGFLLEGFPHSVAQAVALDALLAAEQIPLDAVISYELPLPVNVLRLSGRRVCPSCKAAYHTASQPPRTAGICDQCGRHLVQRADDHPEAVHRRLADYQVAMVPIADHYQKKGLLLPINADDRPEEVLSFTLDVLSDRGLGF
jgi:adenylate kinase